MQENQRSGLSHTDDHGNLASKDVFQPLHAFNVCVQQGRMDLSQVVLNSSYGRGNFHLCTLV